MRNSPLPPPYFRYHGANLGKFVGAFSLVLATQLYATDIPNTFVINADTDLSMYNGGGYKADESAIKIYKPNESFNITLNVNPTNANSKLKRIFLNNTTANNQMLKGNEFTMNGGKLDAVFVTNSDKDNTTFSDNTINLNGGTASLTKLIDIYNSSNEISGKNVVNISGNFKLTEYESMGGVMTPGDIIVVWRSFYCWAMFSGVMTPGDIIGVNIDADVKDIANKIDGVSVNVDGGDFSDGGHIYAVYMISGKNSSVTNNVINLNVSDKSWDKLNLMVASGNRDLNTFSGNTLNIKGKGNTLEAIGEFKNLNFYLPKDVANNETILKLADTSNLDLKGVKIGVGIVDTPTSLKSGETLNLIEMLNSQIDNAPAVGTDFDVIA